MAVSRRESLQLLMAAAAASAVPGVGKADEPEIIIGSPQSLTGAFGNDGEQETWGLLVGVEMINSGGGIKSLGGAKVKVIAADTTSDNPAQAASVTQRLIQQDHAVALAGPVASAMTLAEQVVAEKARVPLVGGSYADPIVERGMKYTFKTTLKGSKLWNFGFDGTVDMLKSLGKAPKSVAIFCASDAVSQGVYKTLPIEAKRLGIPVAAKVSFQSGLTDPTVIVAPVRQHRPELILLSAGLHDTILIMQAIRGLGINTPVVAAGAANSDAAGQAMGKGAIGMFMPASYNWDLKTPNNSKMVELYHKAHPKAHFPPNGDYLGLGFANILILWQALEKAGSRDGTKIRDALSSTTFTGIPYLGGKVKFDQTGYNELATPLIGEWITPDEIRTVWPQKYQTVHPKL